MVEISIAAVDTAARIENMTVDAVSFDVCALEKKNSCSPKKTKARIANVQLIIVTPYLLSSSYLKYRKESYDGRNGHHHCGNACQDHERNLECGLLRHIRNR